MRNRTLALLASNSFLANENRSGTLDRQTILQYLFDRLFFALLQTFKHLNYLLLADVHNHSNPVGILYPARNKDS